MAVAKIIIKSKDGRNYLADPVWGARVALALKILVILAVLPIFLLLVYSLPFVRPISTLMVKDYVLLQDVDRRWVSIDDIAPVLVNSVMMAEDGQFCSHGGVDWHQLGLVLDDGGRRAVRAWGLHHNHADDEEPLPLERAFLCSQGA
ncbi:monofunctional biosynthetic peptidoglycan transglycosylase [Brucella intermedia M86]|uniref:Monofunctional biosynthetic peptidoglycan transglycosylase n=1 Tax=Brucella intermedia M86 TaxID=1234597 RepID=M5K1M0_9HYPH|nr:monofunctional biosynthetic peptidoglycan transglycosylase [Brucella intermedia M86]